MIERALEILNAAVVIDFEAVEDLIEHRVPFCGGDDIADLITDSMGRISALALLNTVLESMGANKIAAVYNDKNGDLIGFKIAALLIPPRD